MYDIKKLIEENLSYNQQHGVTESDVRKVNELIELIENSRTNEFPLVGDIVRFTSKYGEYYEHAHIENARKDDCYICEAPYVPFVEFDTLRNKIYTSTSGGAWYFIPTEKMKYVGKEKKRFKAWGHCGATANGAVSFLAEVSVWEYVEGEHEFTTKDYDKFYLYINEPDEKFDKRYYLSQGATTIATFDTEEEYKAWLNTFNGVERKGHLPNQKIVWTLKQESLCIPLEEYKKIENAIVDSELLNGFIQECKRVVEGTKITTYFPYQHEKIMLEGVKAYKNYYEKNEGGKNDSGKSSI